MNSILEAIEILGILLIPATLTGFATYLLLMRPSGNNANEDKAMHTSQLVMPIFLLLGIALRIHGYDYAFVFTLCVPTSILCAGILASKP